MNCSAFREQHFAFMDGELDPIELAEMKRHLTECGTCAAHDSVVRRAILLVRNLPRIEPSPDFSSRLQSRLGALSVRPFDKLSAKTRPYLATAIGVAAVGYLAVLAFREPTRDHISAFRPLAAAATSPTDSSPQAVPLQETSQDGLSIRTMGTPAQRVVSMQEPHFVALPPTFSVVGSTDTFTTQLPTPPIMPFGRSDLPGAWSRRVPLRMGGGVIENGGGFTAVRLTQ